MIKKLLPVLIGLLIWTTFLCAQEVNIYKVPKINNGNDESPSIAVNSRGDWMIFYRNQIAGMLYYYKKHGEEWRQPAVVVNHSNVLWTSMVATSDNRFHAIYANFATGIDGIYYTSFDPVTEKWSTPTRIVSGKVEDPIIVRNPKTDELVVVWVWALGVNKEIYVKVMSTNQDIKISTNPWSDTNPYAFFDENGYLYVAWKEDRAYPPGNPDWDYLVGTLAVLNEKYERIFKDEISWDYVGWHFLPSVAVYNNRGIYTLAWSQNGQYYYYEIEKQGDNILFDSKNIIPIAPCPTRPWYEFHSKAIVHGDKIYYIYKDLNLRFQMIQYNPATKSWANKNNPVALADRETFWPWNVVSVPDVGILCIWYTRQEPNDVYYAVYNLPLIIIKSAQNITYQHFTERSLFRTKYFYRVSWKNNEYNIERKIEVSKFKIYRKKKTEDQTKFTLINEVAYDGDKTYSYTDENGITAVDEYEYYVTCVDKNGKESNIVLSINPDISIKKETFENQPK